MEGLASDEMILAWGQAGFSAVSVQLLSSRFGPGAAWDLSGSERTFKGFGGMGEEGDESQACPRKGRLLRLLFGI